MKFDIIIIGAGASGLAAAYHAAAENSQLHILVLEKEKIPGRKLSAAGNGKCNLTNKEFRIECYHSSNQSFLEGWVKKHSYEEIPAFFEELGILLYQKNGYYYPVSNQGKQVTNLLYEKSIDLGVKYVFQTRVTRIYRDCEKKQAVYQIDAVSADGLTVCYQTEHVILAAGGAAAPQLGGCRDGYKLAKGLHLTYHPVYPVLSPVYIDDAALSAAKGVRLDGTVTLNGKNGIFVKESGQIQFNENSLSGIVIMNVSCYLYSFKREELTDCLQIDVLPDISWNQLKDFMLSQKQSFQNESLMLMLSGILPNPFVRYLLKRLGLGENLILKSLSEKQLNRLVSFIKKLTFTPVYKEEYEKAQVTGGGVALEQINPDTFECKQIPGLYITGELLDITGKCGGYNLTFAMLSGIQAVNGIIEKYKNRDICR